MPFFRSLLSAAALALSIVMPGAAALAARPVNLLVVTEDADRDTVPRDNRIYNRVIQQLQEKLNLRGFQVYDETAVGMTIMETHRLRRRDDELIDVARNVSPPMDVVVIFQLYASVRTSSTGIRRPEIFIPGRALNVQTGQVIATFEVGNMQFPPLPLGCDDRECLLNAVGTEARLIAGDLGDTLADKLQGFINNPLPSRDAQAAPGTPPGESVAAAGPQQTTPGARSDDCSNLPTAFILKFRDFTADQFNEIEQLLASFGCYSHHRMTRSGRTFQDIWYETSSDASRLNRNLRIALDYIGAKGNVTQSGNTFEIVSTGTR